MAIRKIEKNITKYYLYSWIYGIAGLITLYYDYKIIASLLIFFCFGFSVADITYPPAEDKKTNDETEQ
jgi:hypothetical protein